LNSIFNEIELELVGLQQHLIHYIPVISKANNNYRNITWSTKVSATQKLVYIKLASQKEIRVSEWVAWIIESNKINTENQDIKLKKK